MELIKRFIDINKNDVMKAGGKGASLGELTKAGISVPPGFVILSDAFDLYLIKSGLNKKIDEILDRVDYKSTNSVENASKSIQLLILDSALDIDNSKEILSSFDNIGTEYVAVRSSATAEDSENAAWAGQLETYLNTSRNELLDNIKRCWASLYTPHAISYRYEKDLNKHNISVAVVVQKMIESEVAGTVFTVHPTREDYNQMVIEAGYGLGEAVVSGLITPDTYIIDKSRKIIQEKNIATQSVMIIRNQKGTGEKEVPKQKRKLQKLKDYKIIELSDICLNIEKYFGFPCDIEWATENDKIFIIQSRPITTLNSYCKKISSAISNELDLITKELESYSLSKHLSYKFIPVICFESSCKCYVNNPYILKYAAEKKQNIISILDYNYEVWGDWSKRYVIKDNQIANEIIRETYYFIKYSDECINKLILKEYALLTSNEIKEILIETDKMLTGLYYIYIFYIDECFEVSDKNINKKLPDIRLLLSECASKLYVICDKIIEVLANIYTSIPWQAFTFATINEIIELIEDPEKNISLFNTLINRPIAYVTINNSLNIFKGKDALDIKESIHIQDPIKNISNKNLIKNKITGTSVFHGKAVQRVIKVLEADYSNLGKIIGDKKNYVIVTPMTRPEIVSIIKDAAAIITDEGGITCHAAIVARELKKPCIVGTKIATQVLKDGDMVEVDAFEGVIKILE